MKLVNWEPEDWSIIKNRLAETVYDPYDLIEGVRKILLTELQRKVVKFQHSCNPSLTGQEVPNPSLVIEPPMYLINLGDPLK